MIKILDKITADGIAAGEVIERPASVVKELIENSLDAGASIIHCAIEQGGIKKITISDNGCGMTPEDAELAFARHATSKLSQISDLDHIITMGFRGEALASIAAVAKVRLRTRRIGAEQGHEVIIEGGKIISTQSVGCPEGTQIEVRDLFFNVPARYKFLKRDQTEQGYIADLISRLALARADISFRLTAKQKDIIHTPGNNNLLSAIYVLYGRETAEAMVEVNYQLEPIKINGYITTPQVTRGNRSRQVVFVNGRNISSKVVNAAINEASKTWFMKGKFPSLVINLEIPLNLVDVNVHPQKTEVRFWDDQIVFRAVYHSLIEALETGATAIKGQFESKKNNTVEPLVLNEKQETTVSTAKQTEFDYQPQSTNSLQTEYNYTNERLYPVEQAQAFIKYQDQTSEKSEDQTTNLSQITNEDTTSELAYLLEARLIGQVFQTYILLEFQDNFIIIDQHAAHERIIYEQLRDHYQESKKEPFPKQLLLTPLSMELTAHELSLVEENLAEFEHLGFELDIFGDNTILIRTVPSMIRDVKDPISAIQVLVDSLVDQSFFREDKYDQILHGISCKAAVKANDNLSFSEMKQLLNDLISLKNPFHCPHGRPLIINLQQTDLEKLFKRIV